MIRRLLWAGLILATLAAGGAWLLWHRVGQPYKGFADTEVFVDLPPGTSVQGIAARLADAGVVPDGVTFRLAARLSGDDRRLQAGEYRFADAASPLDVARRLARGDVYARNVTFREGLTIWESSQLFEQSGLGTADDFERAARNAAAIAPIDPAAETLEGYLFPDTYALGRRAGADETVHLMVARFLKAFDKPLRDVAAARGMTPHDVVTLASIVEKETGDAEERPLVAAVYENRLRSGMPLQCDPTVIYALMRARRWRGNLTRADLEVDSPYNTYRYPGLPPGPIASPGRASIEAVLNPAAVPYLYFVSRNDGTHAFASTLEEHARNVEEWQVRFFRRQRQPR